MVKLSTLQRKGLLTLSLLKSARFVASGEVDAVAYWKTYPKFSERFTAGGGAGRFGGRVVGDEDGTTEEESDFAKAARRATAREVAGCPLDEGGVCQPRPSLPPARLYPRSRLAKRVGALSSYSDGEKWRECARKHCSSCLDAIPRGGHLHHSGTSSTAEAAASVAAASTPFDLPLNLWKVLFQAVLTTLNVLCWLIPLKSDKISENKLALSLANAFSGGVFLSLAFGHLIPECVHGFPAGEYNEALPYMLVLSGYLLIFFVEKVAFDAHGLMHAGEEGHDSHGHHTHGREEMEKVKGNGEIAREESGGLGTGRSAVILLGALAVHSVLEMTALGLANTFGESALLSLSIALHQPAESIALLVAFLKSGMPKTQIIRYLSIFSAMGPCGVALGMAVQEFAAPIVDAVMLAVVAGTFVYVGATEVIPEEWEEPDHKWKKFAALMMGIGSVFAITQYTMTLEA